MNRLGARELRGLVMCPWGCGTAVRRTRNNNAKTIFINREPDPRGRIAAYDDGGQWRSRQLQAGEGLTAYERLYMIHNATCPKKRAANGRPVRPPRPVVVPPPPGTIPPQLASQTREQLEAIRQRQRGRTGQ